MIKLVSLNVERSKHLDKIFPFLEREAPDVTCLMEVVERDIPRYEEKLGPCRAYLPNGWHPGDLAGDSVMIGVGLFTKLPVAACDVRYYRGGLEEARTAVPERISQNIGLVSCDVEKDSETFRIIATHFTWTPRGESSDQQRTDLEALFQMLHGYEQFVLCGDLNAPRGGEIFTKLFDHYQDNIPSHYKTSLDVNFHRGIRDELEDKMVDGLFTTTSYKASDVRLEFGISDHAGIVATISRLK